MKNKLSKLSRMRKPLAYMDICDQTERCHCNFHSVYVRSMQSRASSGSRNVTKP